MRLFFFAGDALIAKPVDDPAQSYGGFIKVLFVNSVAVKFDEDFHENFDYNIAYRVEFKASRSTFKQMHGAVEFACKALGKDFLFPREIPESESSQLDIVLDGGDMKLEGRKIDWLNPDLNEYQKCSVIQILRDESRPHPFMVFGPPGTGKTTTLIEAIVQTFRNLPDARILIGTHTNCASDLILSKLIQYDFVREHVVRLVGFNHALSQKLNHELNKYCVSVNIKNPANEQNENGLRMNFAPSVVDKYRIVISTNICVGAIKYSLKKNFTHVFIDEAGQSSEPESLIPLMLVDPEKAHVTLAGDSKQMRPLVISRSANDYGLNVSFFERMFESYQHMSSSGDQVTLRCDKSLGSILLLNYRSLPSILSFYNETFYDSLLKPTISATDSKEARNLKSLHDGNFFSSFRLRPGPECGILFVNVNGRNKREEDSPSWMNSEEAKQVRWRPLPLDLSYTHSRKSITCRWCAASRVSRPVASPRMTSE